MSDRLAALARRVQGDPFFLAFAFSAFARSEHLDEQGLADRLGCDLGKLVPLRLCRRPRADRDAATFRTEVAAIATRYGADADALAAIIRRADALAVMRDAEPSSGVQPGQLGTLLAARDREPQRDEEDDEGTQG